MNRYADMLMRDGRRGDRRNPYGSRGGYVVSDRARSARTGRYIRDRRDTPDDMRRDDYRRDYADEDYRRGGRGDMGSVEMSYRKEYEDDYRRDYADDYEYEDDYREMDYRRGDYARGGRGRSRRDYRHEREKFPKEDAEEWKHEMKNEDGTRGEHFSKEQVERAAKSVGIDMDEFGETAFCLAMNMMYSDYCKVAQKYGVDRPEYYADLAKAFLRDKDFDGTGEEKLYIYYKCIVEQD